VLGGCFFQEPGFVLFLELYANLDTADESNSAFMIFLTRGTNAVLYLVTVWYLMDVINKCPLFTELKYTLQTGSICVKGCLC
jgi:hypothetical protein